MPYAILFPGQGSQTPTMRDDVEPSLLERTAQLVGEDPFARVGESTRFAQPAIFGVSVSRWRAIASERAWPVAAAGHSLGEFAALVAAGAVDADDALRLVVLRGELMAEAGGGTMLALLGASDEQAVEFAAAHGVSVANLNAPGQIILSGDEDRLSELAAGARSGGFKALELGVAGAFHSPAMLPAVAPFAQALRGTTWRAPAFPVISCTTARPIGDPARELAAALTSPVRWTDTMRALAALGADEFVDVGPGRVLDRLVRRTLPEPARA